MDRDGAARFRVASAHAVFDHFVGESTRGFFGVRRRRFHVVRRAVRDVEELDVEHQHASGFARLTLVGQRLRDPQAPLLADHHQLHAFAEPGDHTAHAKRRRLSACDGAVEHFSVGRPPGVIDHHQVGGRRVIAARPGLDHFRGEAGRRFRRIGRRSSDVGRRRHDCRRGRLDGDRRGKRAREQAQHARIVLCPAWRRRGILDAYLAGSTQGLLPALSFSPSSWM